MDVPVRPNRRRRPRPVEPREDTPKPSREHLDELLDEAIEESFPASDPEAIIIDR